MRVRKKRKREVRILYNDRGWNNTIIVSDVPGERKENTGRICRKNILIDAKGG